MRKFFLLSLIFGCFFLCAATLWDDAAGDIYSRKIRYRVNDSIKIKIDEKTKLKYTGSSKTLKTASINSQGGELAGVFEIVFSPLVAYWKSSGQGELLCQIRTDLPLDTVQKLFADTWQADTADIRWSNIHLPASSFLWISA